MQGGCLPDVNAVGEESDDRPCEGVKKGLEVLPKR